MKVIEKSFALADFGLASDADVVGAVVRDGRLILRVAAPVPGETGGKHDTRSFADKLWGALAGREPNLADERLAQIWEKHVK